MKQSRRMSLVEAVANVLVGYGVAVLTQILVFPFIGLRTSLSRNLLMGLVLTVVSIGRSYALRRAFERIRMHYAETTRRAVSTDTSATPMMLSPGLVEQTSLDILGQHRSERRSSGAVKPLSWSFKLMNLRLRAHLVEMTRAANEAVLSVPFRHQRVSRRLDKADWVRT